MKSLLKITTCAVALAATAVMAGSFPFPQNMKSPHGYTIPFADTQVIKDHYALWKKAWYDESRGWVLSPEGTGSTVSEGIAYGMLISVYMDDQSVFDKLYGTWKSNAAGNGGGMNWNLTLPRPQCCNEDNFGTILPYLSNLLLFSPKMMSNSL